MGRKSRSKREASPPADDLPARSATSGDQLLIPKEVSNRTLGRMVVFAGVPFALALGTLAASYLLIRSGVRLPNAAVLLVQLLFFGLSVLGITYGFLSASWDPARPGSLLGIREFRDNSRRVLAALREEGQKRREEKRS